MKTKVLLTFYLLSFIFLQANCIDKKADKNNQAIIFATGSTKNLVQSLANKYEQEKNGTSFRIEVLDENTNSSQFNTPNLRIVSETDNVAGDETENTTIIIGREIFVPVINSGNPYLAEIVKRGLKPAKIASAISGNSPATWANLFESGEEENTLVHFYFQNDAGLTDAFSGFLNISPALLSEMKFEPEILIKKVEDDKSAIGFVRLTDVLTQQNSLGNLSFLPLDRNENGQLDFNEKIYSNVNEFKRGVWIGKYPQSLINNVYAITQINTGNTAVINFVNWILTDGQKWIEPAGFTELVSNERQLKLEKISQANTLLKSVENNSVNSFWTILVVALLALAGVVAFLRFFSTGKVKKAVLQAVPQLLKTLNEQSFEIPNGLFFDKSHTWIYMEKDGQVKIGIDDFIPKVTGKLTRIVMKNPGDSVKRKDPVVQLIQQGKQITIYSPVSGIITDINEDLVTSPESLNESPYENGWIYQIEPSNWLRETEFFKLGQQYREWIKSELTRLKDFVACSHNLQLVPNAKVAYQEGGEVIAQPLKEMSPQLWEDFQTYFIDTADMY